MTYQTILGNDNHVDSTYTGGNQEAVYISGGMFLTTRPRTLLKNEFLNSAARTVDASRTSTFVNFDLGVTRDVRIGSVPKHNIGRRGQYRLQRTDTIAWSGLTVSGINTLGATSLNVNAARDVTLNVGDGFSIAGDGQLYQVATRAGFGENLFTRSEAFDNATWTKYQASVSANSELAPGLVIQTADTLIESTATDEHNISQTQGVTSGEPYTMSVFVKANGRSQVMLDGSDTHVGSGNNCLFDLDAGTVTNNGNAVGVITALSDDWFRISATFIAEATSTATFYLRLYNGGLSYHGDGASGVLIWGAQLSNNDSVIDYVYTDASEASSSGSIDLIRVDTSGTGLALATVGAEVIKCRAGKFHDVVVYDSGYMDVWEVIYPFGTLEYGHPSLADGKATEEDVATGNIKIPLADIQPNSTLARYHRLDISDEANTDGYVSLARMFLLAGYEPTNGMAYGAEIGRFTDTTVNASPGGAKIYNRKQGGRTIRFAVNNLPQSEGLSRVGGLQRTADIAEQILFVMDKNGSLPKHETVFVARLTQLDPQTFPYFEHMDAVFSLEEVIA